MDPEYYVRKQQIKGKEQHYLNAKVPVKMQMIDAVVRWHMEAVPLRRRAERMKTK